MFVTSDPELYERVFTLSNHGRARGQTKQFWPDEVGYKYKMSNVQAAIGLAQIERIGDLIARKREILAIYRARLAKFQGLAINPEPEGTENGGWMPTVVFAPELGITTALAQAAFLQANIDARVFFNPLSSLPMFSPVAENLVSREIASRAINLPSYHDMGTEDLDRVIAIIEGLVK